MGGWCAYYIPVEDSKGNKAGIDSFRTYRLSDEDFDNFQRGFTGKGSSYEEAIADRMLPSDQDESNLFYIHLVAAEVDPSGSYWTGTIFQPDYHNLDTEDGGIDVGYPRFGSNDKAKVYHIDRGSQIEPFAMRVESIYVEGAVHTAICSLYAGLIIALTIF